MVELLVFLKTLPKVVGPILKHVLMKRSTVFYSLMLPNRVRFTLSKGQTLRLTSILTVSIASSIDFPSSV